jgi:hypothetical protein
LNIFYALAYRLHFICIIKHYIFKFFFQFVPSNHTQQVQIPVLSTSPKIIHLLIFLLKQAGIFFFLNDNFIIYSVIFEIFISMRVSHAHLKLTDMMRIQKIRCIRHSRSFWDRVGYDHLVILLAVIR